MKDYQMWFDNYLEADGMRTVVWVCYYYVHWIGEVSLLVRDLSNVSDVMIENTSHLSALICSKIRVVRNLEVIDITFSTYLR